MDAHQVTDYLIALNPKKTVMIFDFLDGTSFLDFIKESKKKLNPTKCTAYDNVLRVVLVFKEE